MFSFIKWLGSTISKLKKNKGLWFTTLSVISTLGIATSMIVINQLTSGVAKDTYIEERRIDLAELDNNLVRHYDKLLGFAAAISVNKDVIKAFKEKKNVLSTFNVIIESINSKTMSNKLEAAYYLNGIDINNSENTKFADIVFQTSDNISGVLINKKGTRIIGMVPVIENNVTIGVLELSEFFYVLREDFESSTKEFVFVLEKHQLININLRYKSGKYQDINEQYRVAYRHYDSRFFSNAQDINFDDLQHDKYHLSKYFYTTYTPVNDLYGNPIGLALIGQDSNQANSFVNISQNMINSVTTVALGLVISLILFMF